MPCVICIPLTQLDPQWATLTFWETISDALSHLSLDWTTCTYLQLYIETCRNIFQRIFTAQLVFTPNRHAINMLWREGGSIVISLGREDSTPQFPCGFPSRDPCAQNKIGPALFHEHFDSTQRSLSGELELADAACSDAFPTIGIEFTACRNTKDSKTRAMVVAHSSHVWRDPSCSNASASSWSSKWHNYHFPEAEPERNGLNNESAYRLPEKIP